MHTAIEINLLQPWQRNERALSLLEILKYDIKAFDQAPHKKWVDVSNAEVLENGRRLADAQTDFIVGTAIIPGVDDTSVELRAMCDLIGSFPKLMYCELLSFNPSGVRKCPWLGEECALPDWRRRCPDDVMPLAREAVSRGIPTRVDGRL
jgi:pyruvate-formate lyase-activating enzyme